MIDSLKFINIFPAFWRFNLRKLESFKFYECQSENELLEYTRSFLNKNKTLSRWLDNYNQRPQGYYYNLTNLKFNSKVRRALNYASKLLISIHIRNDTGLKGGISGIYDYLDYKSLNKKMDIIINIPERIRIIKNRELFFSNEKPIIRNKDSELVIPVDCEKRITINSHTKDKLDSISRDIFFSIINLKLSFKLKKGRIYTFAVDFIKNDENWMPLEWHFPGRGIGMHLIPLYVSCDLYSKIISSMFHIIAEKIKSIYGYCNVKYSVNGFNYLFHDLDRILINMLNMYFFTENEKNINNMILFESETTYDKLKNHSLARVFPENLLTIKSLIIKNGDQLDEKILYQYSEILGKWVVIKQYINLPWWHKNRIRPEFIILSSKTGLNTIKCFLKSGTVQIQSLVTDSVDLYGNFGELRLYYIIFS